MRDASPPVKSLGTVLRAQSLLRHWEASQHIRAFQCVLFKQKYKHKRLQLLIGQIYSWDYLINMNRLNNINILSSYVEVELNKFYLVLDTADTLNEQISLHVTLRFNLERRTSWLALDPSILSLSWRSHIPTNKELTGNESEGELVSKRRSLIKFFYFQSSWYLTNQKLEKKLDQYNIKYFLK